MTEDSAFKRQVRTRMAESGEKYTLARRRVIEDAAIRDVVQRSIGEAIEEAVGLSAVEVDFAAGHVRVTIHAARPDLAWGFHRPPLETEGIWRELKAERLSAELRELTGQQVRLYILPVPGPQETPG